MPKARCTSYTLAFKLKVIAEAEAVENNSETARDYGISESMVRRWTDVTKESYSPLHDSSQTANAVSTRENLQHG